VVLQEPCRAALTLRAQREAHTRPKHNFLDSQITIGSFLWLNGVRRSKTKVCLKMAERLHHQMKTNLTEQKYFAFDNKTSNGKQFPKYCCDQGRVLRGLKILSAPNPQNLNPTRPTPQEFEKSCSLPPRTLSTSTRRADHPSPHPPYAAPFPSQPQLSENYSKLTTRASFCCNKIVRSVH